MNTYQITTFPFLPFKNLYWKASSTPYLGVFLYLPFFGNINLKKYIWQTILEMIGDRRPERLWTTVHMRWWYTESFSKDCGNPNWQLQSSPRLQSMLLAAFDSLSTFLPLLLPFSFFVLVLPQAPQGGIEKNHFLLLIQGFGYSSCITC